VSSKLLALPQSYLHSGRRVANRLSPHSKGLIRLYDFSNRGIDISGRHEIPWSGNPQRSVTGKGIGTLASTPSVLIANDTIGAELSSGITVMLYATRHANGGGAEFIFGEYETDWGGNRNWGYYASNDGWIYVYVGTTVSQSVKPGADVWPIGETRCIVATYGDGDNNIRLFSDGVEAHSVGQTGTVLQNNWGVSCLCWSGTAHNLTYYLGGVWNRCMSPTEVARMSRNISDLVSYEPAQIWMPRAVASGAPTLSSPTMVNITTTTATPRVTVTF
jgi:hypothetical protein